MKIALVTAAQAVLFLVVFLAGTLWDPFHLQWFITHPGSTSTRFFVPDGLILMLALYALILVLEAARKRLATSGVWTSLAFVLALVLGLLSKFGFASHDLS